MKADIHPKWFDEARVICACGNSWITGATRAEIRTDICSACHPFYTGEQRIVDTEGQVDRFLKRLQVRDAKRVEKEEREAAKTPENLSLAELGIEKRYLAVFAENGITNAGEALVILNERGDDGILAIDGIGRKVLADLKRSLRAQGFDVPKSAGE